MGSLHTHYSSFYNSLPICHSGSSLHYLWSDSPVKPSEVLWTHLCYPEEFCRCQPLPKGTGGYHRLAVRFISGGRGRIWNTGSYSSAPLAGSGLSGVCSSHAGFDGSEYCCDVWCCGNTDSYRCSVGIDKRGIHCSFDSRKPLHDGLPDAGDFSGSHSARYRGYTHDDIDGHDDDPVFWKEPLLERGTVDHTLYSVRWISIYGSVCCDRSSAWTGTPFTGRGTDRSASCHTCRKAGSSAASG